MITTTLHMFPWKDFVLWHWVSGFQKREKAISSAFVQPADSETRHHCMHLFVVAVAVCAWLSFMGGCVFGIVDASMIGKLGSGANPKNETRGCVTHAWLSHGVLNFQHRRKKKKKRKKSTAQRWQPAHWQNHKLIDFVWSWYAWASSFLAGVIYKLLLELLVTAVH